VASATGEAPVVAHEGQGTEQDTKEAQVAAAGTVVIPSINTTIVSRGDNLWRISQRIYGKGVRYTVIYGANQDQIRNPDLIYPGQVFVLPSQEEQKTN
jgi:nucleoid-associated protein YgaU